MEKKKSKNVLLAIMGVLIVAEIIITIQADVSILDVLLRLLPLAFTALYGFWLYKKPHGNILKYAMLVFALASILASSKALMTGSSPQIVKIVVSTALCYCAGRLDKIEQNKYLLPILGLGFLWVSIHGVYLRIMSNNVTAVTLAYSFPFTINYITLMIAYFVRYNEHKEAGLADRPKK